jgi:hypothetical protein
VSTVGVEQDASSRVFVPSSTAQWQTLLSGSGLNAPSSIWLAQESSGSLADVGAGGRTVTVAGSPTYYTTAYGWTRKCIRPVDGSATAYGTCTIPDVSTTSVMLLQMFALNTVPSGTRAINRIGAVTAETASLTSGNRVLATSNASTTSGTQVQGGVMIVITKLDRANSVLAVYTAREAIKATYSAPAASTTLYLFGNATAAVDAGLCYAALWTGTDAEISDANVQVILNALVGGETTLEKLKAGSLAMKWVATVEGCPYIFTDAPAAAVISAYAGTDWNDSDYVKRGLFVELDNTQSIAPLQPFTSTGTCKLSIVDDGTDALGQFIAKRQGGHETTITASIDCDDTTIAVRDTTTFSSTGTVYIGTEEIAYTGKTATSFTGCTRGKHSPFTTDISGSGGNRFGNPHRVGTDVNHVQMNPVVSSIPRQWIGKRVALRLHTWDAVNQTINQRAHAQLVFAGRITGVSEDKNSVGTTIFQVDHLMHDLEDAVLWRDQFTAEIKPGIALIAGRSFQFKEQTPGYPTANALTVVSGAPASTNEIKEGTYSLSGLCSALNAWLGGEKTAARINGNYTISSPSSNSDGVRTRIDWYNNTTTETHVAFYLTMPWEVSMFLGLGGVPADGGASTRFGSLLYRKGENVTSSGMWAPFETLVFRPMAGQLGAAFSTSVFIDADNVNGTFSDQYSNLPAGIKAWCNSSAQWGVFLFDEKALIVASYDATTQRLRNCWTTHTQMAGDNDAGAATYFGRRADEPDRGPVRIRQILWMEDTWGKAFLKLLYSTGTSGYNHSTYDVLGSGLGVGIPGEIIGGEFAASVQGLPNSDAPVTIMLDEPTKFSDIVAGDLAFRMAFIRWKDQHFEIKQWRTPLNTYSIATLSESNKAAPASDSSPNHRTASEETNDHVRPIIKIDYCRDFAVGRNGDYLRSFMFEDQTSVDDSGGGVRPVTIQLRNTYQQHTAAGASIESGLADFMARMPAISRASRKIARSMDHRYYEVVAPGDIVTVTDKFARDPLTGIRGVNSRAAFVTSSGYDFGGPSPDPGQPARVMHGDVVCNFLDTQRGRAYAPAANIDSTYTSGGYVAGYNAATKTIRCESHGYSHTLTFPAYRTLTYIDEGKDAGSFPAGSKVRVIQRDPTTTSAPLTWTDTVVTQSADDITLTTGLAGFDTTKSYRIIPDAYDIVVTAQKDTAYQADDVNELVGGVDIPWHYSTTSEQYGFTANVEPLVGEFVPDLCYGDKKPYDVGHDRAIATTINAFIDRVSAHQAPFVSPNGSMSPVDPTLSAWATLFFGPIFLGTEHLTVTVGRTLTVAPHYRATIAGNTGKLRVTIMDTPPAMATNPGFLPGECFRDSIINGKYSRSAEWSTTSNTYQQGADAALDLTVKDIFFGHVWILVEGTGYVETYGLVKVVEGPRTVR